jgi:hypothetical protein
VHLLGSYYTKFSSTYFDFYKVIFREVYTKAYKYSGFCQRYACVKLKHTILK